MKDLQDLLNGDRTAREPQTDAGTGSFRDRARANGPTVVEPEPEPEPQDGEDTADGNSFGFERNAKSMSPTLMLRFLKPKKVLGVDCLKYNLPYCHYIDGFEMMPLVDPERPDDRMERLFLRFATCWVTITGRDLSKETKNVTLFDRGIAFHRIIWIQEQEDTGELDVPLVTSIEVSLPKVKKKRAE